MFGVVDIIVVAISVTCGIGAVATLVAASRGEAPTEGYSQDTAKSARGEKEVNTGRSADVRPGGEAAQSGERKEERREEYFTAPRTKIGELELASFLHSQF